MFPKLRPLTEDELRLIEENINLDQYEALKQKEAEETAELLSKSTNDPEALARYAHALYYGIGVEEANIVMAQTHFAKALLDLPEKSPMTAYTKAISFLDGCGVERNFRLGFQFAQQAFADGFLPAAYLLSRCFFDGLGTKMSNEKAFQTYQAAVDQGFIRCKASLAIRYLMANGTEKNVELCCSLINDLSNAGHGRLAAWCYGQYYNWCLKDRKSSDAFFLYGAHEGSLQCLVGLASRRTDLDGVQRYGYPVPLVEEMLLYAHERGGDYTSFFLGSLYQSEEFGSETSEKRKLALKSFRLAADAGDSCALSALGDCHLFGIGENGPDTEAALIVYHELAEERGDAGAFADIGQCYLSANPHVAASWFEKGISNGDRRSAPQLLARLFEEGNGVAKDVNRAESLYKMAVDSGNSLAMCYYAKLLLNSTCQDQANQQSLAVQLLQEATDLGSMPAPGHLGLCYQNGTGVPVDLEKARELFQLGSMRGCERSSLYLLSCPKPSHFSDWMKNLSSKGNPTDGDLHELVRSLCPSDKEAPQNIIKVQHPQSNSEIGIVDSAKANFFNSVGIKTVMGMALADDPVCWDGVAVEWFLDCFLNIPEIKVLKDFDCPVWFVREYGIPLLLRRRNLQSGCVVEHLEEICGYPPKPHHVGKPDVFISFTGKYSLTSFAQMLQRLDRKTIAWIDICCVDQVVWKEKKNDSAVKLFKKRFMKELHQKISAIGSTVLLVDRFDSVMTVLEQIWVIWEIYGTTTSNASLNLLLSEHEMERLRKAILMAKEPYLMFPSIDIRKAKGKEEDVQNIMETLSHIGVEAVNSKVISALDRWYIDVLKTCGLEDDGDGFLIQKLLINRLLERGRLDQAEHLATELVQKSTLRNGSDTVETMEALTVLACVKYIQESFDDAADIQRSVLAGYKTILGKEDRRSMSAMADLANTLRSCPFAAAHAEADQVIIDALSLMEMSLHPSDDLLISTQFERAKIFKNAGDTESAERLLRENLWTHIQKFGDSHTKTVIVQATLFELLIQEDRFEYGEISLFVRKLLDSSQGDCLFAANALVLACSLKAQRDAVVSTQIDFYELSQAVCTRIRELYGEASVLSIMSSVGHLSCVPCHLKSLKLLSEGMKIVDAARLYVAEDSRCNIISTVADLFADTSSHAELYSARKQLRSSAEELYLEVMEECKTKNQNYGYDAAVSLAKLLNKDHANESALSRAEVLSRKAIKGFQTITSDDDDKTVNATVVLAATLGHQSELLDVDLKLAKLTEGKELVETALTHMRTALDSGSVDIANLEFELGIFHEKLGEFSEAFDHTLTAQAILSEKLGNNHSATLIATRRVCLLMHKLGMQEEALVLYHEFSDAFRDDPKIDHEQLAAKLCQRSD